MNTPAHLIFGLAVFGRPNAPKVTAAALAGAILPDLSLYVLSGWHLLVLGTSAQIVFDQLYFSDTWQSIFRIDNSMVLWGIALVMGLIGRAPVVIALCGGAMLHLGLDFLLHNDDGRAHFWPISTWIFESPVSYWDGDHYRNIVGPLEVVLCLVLSRLLWQRFTGWKMRVLIFVLTVAEAAPVVVFWLMFGGPA